MTNKNLMHSGYARIPNDDYKTIDPRCVYAFLEHFQPKGLCIDPCAPSGSGIVTTLTECGYRAAGRDDAFAAKWVCEWIVSNPPYTRGLVDRIINKQLERMVAGECESVAMFMRWNFDFSSKRKAMFKENPHYFGQVKTLFRPIWIEKKAGDPNPFHPYVWHIWKRENPNAGNPATLYSEGKKPAFNVHKAIRELGFGQYLGA